MSSQPHECSPHHLFSFNSLVSFLRCNSQKTNTFLFQCISATEIHQIQMHSEGRNDDNYKLQIKSSDVGQNHGQSLRSKCVALNQSDRDARILPPPFFKTCEAGIAVKVKNWMQTKGGNAPPSFLPHLRKSRQMASKRERRAVG